MTLTVETPTSLTITTWEVVIDFVEPILGTVPKDKEVYKTYIESRSPSPIGDESETVLEVEERGWTGFHTDENGREFVFDYYIKGHLKDVANVLKDQIGVKQMKSKVENYVFIQPRRLYFEPTHGDCYIRGVNERPLRAMTAQGPRTSLARSDTLTGASLRFRLMLLKNTEIKEAQLRSLFEFGTLRGMGQWRTGGWGRYVLREMRPL